MANSLHNASGESKRSKLDVIPTPRVLGRAALFLAGLTVGTVMHAKDSAVKAINKVGDAYMAHEYGETDENTPND